MTSGPIIVAFQQMVEQITTGAEEVVEDISNEGETMVKEMIGSRGTGKTWARTYYKNGIPRSASRPGRVWTGDMQDAIEGESETNPGVVTGKFGWINKFDDYYALQEGGFSSNRGDVVGMFAMADAADWAEEEFKRRMEGVANGV